jgi:hypothetical protein
MSTLLVLGYLHRAAFWTDVEADHDRVGRRGEQNVGLGDGADAGSQDLNLHLVCGELLKGFAEHLGRPADVGFDDQVQLLGFAFAEMLMQRLQADAAAL